MRVLNAGRASERQFLVVEDEMLVALELESMLEELGDEAVGPAPDMERALALVVEEGDLNAALLDLNLNGKISFPVADALSQRNVPFVISTGYGKDALVNGYKSFPLLQKPYRQAELDQALKGLLRLDSPDDGSSQVLLPDKRRGHRLGMPRRHMLAPLECFERVGINIPPGQDHLQSSQGVAYSSSSVEQPMPVRSRQQGVDASPPRLDRCCFHDTRAHFATRSLLSALITGQVREGTDRMAELYTRVGERAAQAMDAARHSR